MVQPRLRPALGAAATLALAGSLLATAPAGAAPSPAGEEHRSPTAQKVLKDAGSPSPVMTRDLDRSVRQGPPARVAAQHLAAHEDVYRLGDAELTEVDVVDSSSVDGASAVRLQQTLRGVPVLGAQYVVQTRDSGEGTTVESVTGRVFPGLSVSTTPTVSQDKARARLGMDRDVAAVQDPQVTDHGLTVLPQGDGVLAWEFEVAGTTRAGEPVRRTVLVDAFVGGVLMSWSEIHTADEGTGVRFDGTEVPLAVTATEDGYELRDRSRAMYEGGEGEIHTYDALGRPYQDYASAMPEDTPLFSSDTPRFDGEATTLGAVDAHVNAGKVYEFFLDEFGRDGLDGQGGTMRSVVNVTSGGRAYANAFWDGTKMVYGSQDGVPFSVALDVVGHEMSHGITEHSANLLYINQSGALNEAISDYFGNAMEVEDRGLAMDDPAAGLVGEHLCADGTELTECAIRDLNDGRRADQDYKLLSVDYDNGGVHLNSTIASGALWDLRESIDPELADQLVYDAQNEYLTPLSGFTDLRVAIELAAKRRHLGDAETDAIARAFDDHGIYAGWEQTYPDDAQLLLKDIVSSYEGYAPHADTAAAVDGDRWAASTMDVAGFFAGNPTYSLTVGTFDGRKPRVVNSKGAWDIQPAADDGRLVWTRVDGDTMSVVEQKGNGVGGTTVVSTVPGESSRPAVDGERVVWITALDGERDVWLRDGTADPVNLTPEEGTVADFVDVDGDVVAWADADNVHTLDLAADESHDLRIGGHIMYDVSSLYVTDDGVWWRLDGWFGGSAYHASHDLGTQKQVLRSLYAGQFAVNDDFFVYDTTTAWGDLSYPEGEGEMHKLRILPVDGLLDGTASSVRFSCGMGAQLSPAFGDGQRIVYLSTSQARTDLVTRDSAAGQCE